MKNTVTDDVCWIFWKMSQELGRKQMIHFRAICTRVSCFLTFSCDLKQKRDTRDDLLVSDISFMVSGSTQKWSKNDNSPGVDAFGGVRNGDRIGARVLHLFFYVVQY